MLNFPHCLAEFESKVLETTEYRRVWFLGNPFEGTQVPTLNGHAPNGPLDELTGSCYFVLPELDTDQGPLGILTIARGRPAAPSGGIGGGNTVPSGGMPSFWDSAELEGEDGGVFAQVTYHPRRSQIELGMNVGSDSHELLGVTLNGATPKLLCGRVLELYFEISAERIFFSVHDLFANGDVSLDGTAPSTGKAKRPWGAPPSGHWWVVSGFDGRANLAQPLPPGFGLSGLRVTLGAENQEAMGSLLYDGCLDHLVAHPPLRVTEKELELLSQHVRSLRVITADVERIRLLLPASGSRPAAPDLVEDLNC